MTTPSPARSVLDVQARQTLDGKLAALHEEETALRAQLSGMSRGERRAAQSTLDAIDAERAALCALGRDLGL